jgi:hypothetical protein
MSDRNKSDESQAPVALRADQVRAMYGLSPEFLRKHPEIPRYRAGHRTVLYRRADIEEFLARRRIA